MLRLDSRSMRRWLAILLLVLLPVQFTWAMVADYCAHEPDATAAHFGHHDHESHGHAAAEPTLGDAGDQATPDDPASPAPQVDCGHCHGHSIGMFDVPAPVAGQAFSSASLSAVEALRADHLPPKPERPQWADLA